MKHRPPAPLTLSTAEVLAMLGTSRPTLSRYDRDGWLVRTGHGTWAAASVGRLYAGQAGRFAPYEGEERDIAAVRLKWRFRRELTAIAKRRAEPPGAGEIDATVEAFAVEMAAALANDPGS